MINNISSLYLQLYLYAVLYEKEREKTKQNQTNKPEVYSTKPNFQFHHQNSPELKPNIQKS